MKLVTAVVRTPCLEHILHSLEQAGLHGATMYPVRGVGEQVTLNAPYAEHTKIEVVVHKGRADDVVRIILEHAVTGLSGDGIITVRSLDYAVQIRTREKLQ